ncbi:uncharacterized protein LOC119077286 [Bradysia coprophila]|uniref:uncharacterized protein LOC119077286 n=1 Tax=Bradysia coprophila TaxID=38358 RepID=UPI00187D6F4C|nr:uncharacterized protein LOC119077286 [Bradysia coprophila]
MTSVQQLLQQIANGITELKQDVTAIQRTLVRMEAGTMQPPCRTRRRSASRATQTWPGQQQQPNQQAHRFAPYQSGPSNQPVPSSSRNSSSVAMQAQPVPSSSRNSSSVAIQAAGPAEIRLSNMRRVLNKAADTPIPRTICINHKRFGKATDIQRCPDWCTMRNPAPANPPMDNELDISDAENLPPPLLPEPMERNAIPTAEEMSLELENELLNLSE